MNILKKSGVIVLIVFGLLSFPFISTAGNRAYWIEGEVTRTPYETADAYHEIEVDLVVYKIPPNTKIYYRYLRNEGAYDEEVVMLDSISVGQKITMKIKKKKVIQIILF